MKRADFLARRAVLVAAVLLPAITMCVGALYPRPAHAQTPAGQAEAVATERAALRRLVSEEYRAHRVRLFRVSGRLRLAGAELCGESRGSVVGLLVTPEGEGAAGSAGWRVIDVLPGSPADGAGVRAGDRIVGAGGASFRDADAWEATGREVRGPVRLEVEREGARRRVEVRLAPGCGARITLVGEPVAEARSLPGRIEVTAGMMRFVESDDELALVVGHELAHAARGEFRYSPAPEREARADYLGSYLTARAGFSVRGAAAFWRRLAVVWLPAATAPPNLEAQMAARIAAAEATAREIARKREQGLPLEPDPRP